ncbi:MAG: 2-oxo-4-hydroxy-4-carboxy-5-ureidoimidazoline decarboxylase [Nocardiopsaceae bacterium]|jgi:2-oxo-4-hydroxy-4-carboxy-5-ureidoimidazoline decarboxylase|nr:2-oxo-4-hydroxy-4-carboxy-5-ureidoimidazoline decarboxylase [Nocardiopsaceae bacterium]
MPTVDQLNRLHEDAVRQELRGCCSSARWIEAVADARPYADEAALIAASDDAVARLTEADLREALDDHPRIGDRRVEEGSLSSHEQAGVRGADDGLRHELDEGNAEYERRFGHIYLACATGRSAGELLAFLRERLGNDPGTEWSVVASELAKINQIRLRRLLGTAG